MRNFLILLFTSLLFFNCQKDNKMDVDYVTTKFKEYSDKIEKVEYNIRRIDTFPGATVWNNTGFAFIKKDKNDEIFGFSFYGKRDDISNEYVYDNGTGFEISKSSKTYETDMGNYGFIGSPGGQMISQNIFWLDSIYKSVSLTETDNRYILRYEYENDTTYNNTDIIKTIELTKDKYFPIKVTRTSKRLGNRTFGQTILSNIKINEQVQNSIEKYKDQFKDFEIIQPKKRETNMLLGKELPNINLSQLFDQDKVENLKRDKLTLIDFWEVWCSPCIASFPKVEILKNKYPSQLKIIGIVSEDIENAKKLVKKKGTTFQNVIGNSELKKFFSINSWPRYFLVDNSGIVRKEYFGFSEQIEIDIKELLKK